MFAFFKSLRFLFKLSRPFQTFAAPMPGGILTSAEIRRLVADMVD